MAEVAVQSGFDFDFDQDRQSLQEFRFDLSVRFYIAVRHGAIDPETGDPYRWNKDKVHAIGCRLEGRMYGPVSSPEVWYKGSKFNPYYLVDIRPIIRRYEFLPDDVREVLEKEQKQIGDYIKFRASPWWKRLSIKVNSAFVKAVESVLSDDSQVR